MSAMFTRLTPVQEYSTLDVALPTSVLTYVGKQRADGAWVVVSVDTTTGVVIRYATTRNNQAYSTYAAAWTARASLIYGTPNTSF